MEGGQSSKMVHASNKGSLSPTGVSVVLTLAGRQKRKKPPPANPALMAGSSLTWSCALPLPLLPPGLFHRDFPQGNALDGRPDDGQAAHLGREHINLVGTLPDVAK